MTTRNTDDKVADYLFALRRYLTFKDKVYPINPVMQWKMGQQQQQQQQQQMTTHSVAARGMPSSTPSTVFSRPSFTPKQKRKVKRSPSEEELLNATYSQMFAASGGDDADIDPYAGAVTSEEEGEGGESADSSMQYHDMTGANSQRLLEENRQQADDFIVKSIRALGNKPELNLNLLHQFVPVEVLGWDYKGNVLLEGRALKGVKIVNLIQNMSRKNPIKTAKGYKRFVDTITPYLTLAPSASKE